MSTVISDAGVQFADASVQPSAARPQIQSLGVSLAANALTIASQSFSLAFKTSLTSGAVSTITGTPAALTIPSGATLGSVNAVQSTIIVAVLNNAGTLEYTVQNLAGGSDMSETGLISTTAISAGSTASNVWYSNTARTNVPYAVIYRIDSTQATAGAWATAPSLLQGVGGQALAAMASAGFGQTIQVVTGSRALSTTYYNTTGREITVYVKCGSMGTGGGDVQGTVDGETVFQWSFAPLNIFPSVIFKVPPGKSYSVVNNNGSGFSTWKEQR